MQHVVVVGGGFGGLQLVRALRRAAVRITLVDRRNFHLFQPLLYQVATGALSPANIASPLRGILRRQRNVEVVLGEVVGFDVPSRRIKLRDGEIGYDVLVLAAGARHSYFGKDDWEQYAPGLKTIEDATQIRGRILTAFEAAERETDQQHRQALLTFIIVGGGPTGVELAGALAELARRTLDQDFRNIDPADARILLIEAMDRPLGAFPQPLSEKAVRSLDRLGVRVRTQALVTDVSPSSVTLKQDGSEETIQTGTVLWAAGVQASPLARWIGEATGTELDRAGRVKVQPDLTLPGHPEIFVVGDMAHCADADGKPLPGVAPVAIQQARYVAKQIKAGSLAAERPPFRYHSPGNLATIGRGAAIADFGWLRVNGYFAWLLWLFVHLMNIVAFENRLLVFIQWSWNYITFSRSARLITESSPRS